MPLAEFIQTFNRTTDLTTDGGPPADAELVAWEEQVAARFGGLTLTSVFQPIYDLERQQVVGHEALLRATASDGRSITPEAVFSQPAAVSAIVYLDRLVRTLHTLNFLGQRQRAGGYLYLNVHPRHLTTVSTSHGLVFEAILKRCGLSPADIVLELLESEIDDDSRLLEAIGNYRQRGYLMAIDDFGRRHSNLDRLWRLQPEIVKLDRSLVVAAAEDRRAARVLAKLVEIIHDLAAIAVAEGIETEGQLHAARDAGADLVQGYLLGRPVKDCVPTHRRTDVAYNPTLIATGAHP